MKEHTLIVLYIVLSCIIKTVNLITCFPISTPNLFGSTSGSTEIYVTYYDSSTGYYYFGGGTTDTTMASLSGVSNKMPFMTKMYSSGLSYVWSKYYYRAADNRYFTACHFAISNGEIICALYGVPLQIIFISPTDGSIT
jgi:hypothetical protein